MPVVCIVRHGASPSSRSRLCKQLSLFTAKVVTNALAEILRSQKPSRFDNRSFAMNPLWLNPVEPRTLGRQPVRNDAHALFAGASLLRHCLIVLAPPGSDLLTHVPGGVGPLLSGEVCAGRGVLYSSTEDL